MNSAISCEKYTEQQRLHAFWRKYYFNTDKRLEPVFNNWLSQAERERRTDESNGFEALLKRIKAQTPKGKGNTGQICQIRIKHGLIR